VTVLKKLYSAERLLGRTKFCWKDGHMELPWRLIHESDAAKAVEARSRAGAATAATLAACDERIVFEAMTAVVYERFQVAILRVSSIALQEQREGEDPVVDRVKCKESV